MTHQFHLRSTSAMLLTEAASVKLSRLKKSSQFLFPSLPHAALSLRNTETEVSNQIWSSIRNLNFFSPLFLTLLSLSQKHRNRSRQPDLKLGFKSCIEFKLWKQPYLWYLQSINIGFLFCNGDSENKDQRRKATSICICASRFPTAQFILVELYRFCVLEICILFTG